MSDTHLSENTADLKTGVAERRPGLPRAAKFAILLAVLLIGLAVASIPLRLFVVQTFFIPSVSMEPGIQSGDRVIVNRLDADPERGDVIVHEIADTAPDGFDHVITRVVAVGGDTIEAVDGAVVLNGQPLAEPYLGESVTTDDFGPVSVPEGQLFVMGDNRPSSADSRFDGPIPADSVTGTVLGQ